MQRVVDEGPGRGVRLIASSTQPAAVFAAADRQQGTLRGDAVIALRTATSQDSMDLLGEPDAWYLPETPGHAYLGSAAGTIEGPIRLFDGSGIAGDLVERLVTA